MSFIDDENIDTLKIHPQLSNDNLSETEVLQKLQNAPKEHLYFFKDGQQFARFEGESNYVNPPEAQLIRMKDCVVLHNHPNNQSFSMEDMNAIIKFNAQKLIVTSPVYTYTVIRSGNIWTIDLSDFRLEEIISSIESSLLRMVRQGEILDSERSILENHYIWSYFLKQNNIYYEQKEN